jgi:hypothetical protein
MEDKLAQPMAVHVVGVQIPFLDLVVLLVKFALALIPALFIITAASALFWGCSAACSGTMDRRPACKGRPPNPLHRMAAQISQPGDASPGRLTRPR